MVYFRCSLNLIVFRNFELRPLYDKAQEKCRHLERDVARLKDELRESEIRHQKIYLQMYLKGQQSAKLEENKVLI